MIWRLLSNCWYYVLVNGKSSGYFNKRVRHGDPLSPVLYIIASEIISRGLKSLHEKFPSLRYTSISDRPIISHLSYADVIIIFCNGNSVGLKKHMKFLDAIHKFSGLSINKNKSCYVTPRRNESKDTIIKSITGCQKAELPLNYLGCLLYWGRIKVCLFLPLNNKLQSKLDAWKGKILRVNFI